MTPPTVRVHGFVSGRVQGVWYREACRSRAEAHGVAGWVRNLDDGRVEVVLEGERTAVDAVAAWCRTGPARARVDTVEMAEERPGSLRGFAVR